jgi:CBS domain-containing protein
MYEFLEYRVADAMSYHPVTLAPTATLAEVERAFDEHDYECLPVCNHDGMLLGVVTKLDFLRPFAFARETMLPRYEEIMARPAASVMTEHPITVSPETPLTRVLQLMIETRHKSLPVMLGGLIVGMIARRDVVRALGRAAAGERPGGDPGEDTWTIPPSFAR